MASPLDPYADVIIEAKKSDKDIAKEAGVTTGVVRAYRNRMKSKGVTPAVASAVADAAKPQPTKQVPLPTAPKKAKADKNIKKPKAAPKKVKATSKAAPKDASEKVCPKCGKTAKGEEQIQELFGFRQVSAGKNKGKKRIPQSQCRACRAAATKASKAKKKAQSEK